MATSPAMASGDLTSSVEKFAKDYASLFSSPDTSSPEAVGALASKVSKFYRPGLTVFTEGQISRFESQSEAAHLIETEMRANITTGLGTCLIMDDITVAAYSETAATAHITWTFHPGASSEYAGRTWTFTNIYGYRAAGGGEAGWEYVVRDLEVSEMRKVTGRAFNE